MDNPFTIIFLCAVLIMPVITFFFCLLFNMNLGGSFDNGDYIVYIILFVGMFFFDKKLRKYY
jgi:hypothetical protein